MYADDEEERGGGVRFGLELLRKKEGAEAESRRTGGDDVWLMVYDIVAVESRLVKLKGDTSVM